ncbi:dynein light chain Tctex-type 5-B-like isoform X2 [Babylonia areolata]|uniref:dynein light chain Tctex-type 5-B-like isoform X2 n=1 Tax=Babylonia areolata TaxID=304850 RepID=UPI003FD66FFB
MSLQADRLTLQALRRHDKIHPRLQASPAPAPRCTQPSVFASTPEPFSQQIDSPNRMPMPHEPGSSSSPSSPRQPMRKHAMKVFRLVAATRSWKHFASKNTGAPLLAPGTHAYRYENTYQLHPGASSKFSPAKVEAILKDVLESRLKDVRYDPEQCRRHTTELVSLIQTRAKTCRFERYKLVCNVLIMENKGQGSRVVSRGLLDTETDSFATYTFRSSSLVAVASVHGLYFE